MTPQNIFDTVSKHLFKQGKRSVDNRYCRYHGPDELMCSVGVLIPKETYFSEIDQGNKTIKSLITQYPDNFPDWMVDNVDLLSDLQCVHDCEYNWENPDNLYNALVKVASIHDVSPDILETLDDFEVSQNEELVEETK